MRNALLLVLCVAGCSTEDRLHGTWVLSRTAIHRTDASTVALTYPATQVDECIQLWGYDPTDCQNWYDDTIHKSVFYDFDSVTGTVAIVQRSCVDDLCGDDASTTSFAVYKVDGVRHVAIGGTGQGMELSFTSGEMHLRDVQISCSNGYYYYYEDTGPPTCTSTITEWTFTRG
ncbi:MAG: hypothetical protein EP330_19225 [Deltaproteobacteria bacterium]|nr:MAG: hypothetical protein EP330_19225 [Deltaproteobacteria bacterium]